MHIAYINSIYCGHGDTTEAALDHAASDGAPWCRLSVGIADAELEQRILDVGGDVGPLRVEGGVVSVDRMED